MSGYYRIELDADLDIDEVAPLLINASNGQMVAFDPEDQKTTDGKVERRAPTTAPTIGWAAHAHEAPIPGLASKPPSGSQTLSSLEPRGRTRSPATDARGTATSS